MTTSPAPAPIRTIPDAALVLAKRKLRTGMKLADTSRFGDDVWVLTPAIHQRHLGRITLDFRTVPIRFRLVAKELLYLLLTGDLPPECASIRNITSIQSFFYFARSFLCWVDQRQAAALSALTTADLEEFERHLASQRISKGNRQQKWRAARLFWLCRANLTADRLSFDPAAFLAEDGQAGGGRSRRGSENTTDRIPEAVHAPLLVWALRWVDDFADDVLRACTEWSVLYACSKDSRLRRSKERGRAAVHRSTVRSQSGLPPCSSSTARRVGRSRANMVP